MKIHEANKVISQLPFPLQILVKKCFDQQLSMLTGGEFHVDVIKLDELVDQENPDYNSEECTYKDQKDVSPRMAIEFIYGKEAGEIISKLI